MGSSDVKNLRNCRIFSNLDDGTLEEMAHLSRTKSYGAKESIFNEGDPCDGFFLLTEGVVKLYKLSPDGREHVLHVVWPGDTFAEAALFLGDSYPAYCETLKPSKALMIPKRPFLNFVKANPEVALKMLGGMALWLRRLVSQVETLALRDSAARLAGYLTEHNAAGIVLLEAPKLVVASHLGMTPETLSRLFFKFETLGVIKVRGRRIRVLNEKLLQSIGTGDIEV